MEGRHSIPVSIDVVLVAPYYTPLQLGREAGNQILQRNGLHAQVNGWLCIRIHRKPPRAKHVGEHNVPPRQCLRVESATMTLNGRYLRSSAMAERGSTV